jgi:hypothetical protein
MMQRRRRLAFWEKVHLFGQGLAQCQGLAEDLEHVPRMLDANRWQAPCGCVVEETGARIANIHLSRCAVGDSPGHVNNTRAARREWLAQNAPKPEPERPIRIGSVPARLVPKVCHCGVRLDDPYHDASHRERECHDINTAAYGEPHEPLDRRIASFRREVDECTVGDDAMWEREMAKKYGRNWSGPSDPDDVT